ncbi:hypothetical protein ONE63_009345 [Megalurothrips usitatus]|uniref:Uncharacterized protein n=1 Tax=Megalurothrips usitatus TaxID=439358 RepID=A0AAV7XMY5_9NEOP|nr:hypothetical protein ONE63_009345 [Megalurothrips usitatus]
MNSVRVPQLAQVLHAQEIDPDAEVIPVGDGDTVVVNQPALPAINVDTSNVIHNNIPSAQPVVVPVPAQQQVLTAQARLPCPPPQVVVPAPATTAAPAVVTSNPVVVNPVATGTVARYGVGVMPLGGLLGLGGVGLGGMGMGLGGLGAAMMMPRVIVG